MKTMRKNKKQGKRRTRKLISGGGTLMQAKGRINAYIKNPEVEKYINNNDKNKVVSGMISLFQTFTNRSNIGNTVENLTKLKLTVSELKELLLEYAKTKSSPEKIKNEEIEINDIFTHFKQELDSYIKNNPPRVKSSGDKLPSPPTSQPNRNTFDRMPPPPPARSTPSGTFSNKKEISKQSQQSGLTLQGIQPFLNQSITSLPTNKPLPTEQNAEDPLIKLIEEFNTENNVEPMNRNTIAIAKLGDKILTEAKKLDSVDKINDILTQIKDNGSQLLTKSLNGLIATKLKSQSVSQDDTKLKNYLGDLKTAYESKKFKETKRLYDIIYEKYPNNNRLSYVKDWLDSVTKLKETLQTSLSLKPPVYGEVYTAYKDLYNSITDDDDEDLSQAKKWLIEYINPLFKKMIKSGNLDTAIKLYKSANEIGLGSVELTEMYETEKKKAEEAEEKKKADELIEKARLASEAKRKLEEEAEKAKQAEKEKKRLAEEARRKLEEEEAERLAAEMKKKAAEEETRLKAEEEEEEEARLKAVEAEKARLEAEAARLEQEKIKSDALDNLTSATLVLSQGIDQAIEEKLKLEQAEAEKARTVALDAATSATLALSHSIDKATEEQEKASALDAATQSTLTLSHSIDKAAEEQEKASALDSATSATLTLSHSIDQAIDEKEKASALDTATVATLTLSHSIDQAVEEQEKASALDAATQSTLTLSHSIDKATEKQEKASALDAATQSTLTLSHSIDQAVEEQEKASALDAATQSTLTLSHSIDQAVEEQEKASALDTATSATLTLSHSIDQAIDEKEKAEKAKAEEVARSNALDTATQTTLVLSQAIDSAIETIQKALVLDSATSATLALSHAIDNAVQEQERKRLEEQAAAQEMERKRLEELAAVAAEKQRQELAAEKQRQEQAAAAEKQRQELAAAEKAAAEKQRQELAAAEKQRQELAAEKHRQEQSALAKIQYGWPEDFRDLPAIPANDIKSYTDLIKLTINSDKDRNYNHKLISAKDIGDQSLPSNLIYLPAGIFDKKKINDAGAIYEALSEYKNIYENTKTKLFGNKITTDEIRRITNKSLTSDADLNKWIEQKINGR